MISWKSESDPKLAGEAIVHDLKERVDGFGEPFRTIMQSIPGDCSAWHNRLSSWTTQPWDSRGGTVTLAGDAAHAMTFRKS